MIDTIKAWHFVGSTLRDGRPIPRNGSWLRHEGQIKICASGLHASRRPWNALQYAPMCNRCALRMMCFSEHCANKQYCNPRIERV